MRTQLQAILRRIDAVPSEHVRFAAYIALVEVRARIGRASLAAFVLFLLHSVSTGLS